MACFLHRFSVNSNGEIPAQGHFGHFCNLAVCVDAASKQRMEGNLPEGHEGIPHLPLPQLLDDLASRRQLTLCIFA